MRRQRGKMAVYVKGIGWEGIHGKWVGDENAKAENIVCDVLPYDVLP